MSVSLVLGSLCLAYFVYNAFKLAKNYFKARKSGFPIYITPVDPGNPFWIILAPFILPTLRRLLPYQLWRPLDLSTYGYEWRDFVAGRSRPSVYALCAPKSSLELMVEDADIANVVLTKRRDFPQDALSVKFLNVVGKNLLASDGEDWQRQRRLIAPMLNERIMSTVWQESVEQTRDMAVTFVSQGGTTDGTVEGLTRIAFNVLQRVGYGVHEKWSHHNTSAPNGHAMPYSAAIRELVDGFILIALVRSSKLLKASFMPENIRRKGLAMEEFAAYTQEMLEREQQVSLESDAPRTSLLSLMAQITDRAARGKLVPTGGTEKNTMSDDEIRGNLYQFTLAGFDTTANTLAYSASMLAIEPKWQDWIAEEIGEVKKLVGPDAGYADILPRLPRCLALMYETLRRFTPVAHIIRDCPGGQTVMAAGKTYRIPPHTRVTVVFQGIHEQQGTWGEDQHVYRPTRWTEPSSNFAWTTPLPDGLVAQPPSLQAPVKGTFLPWSAGPRICPGMKMAQVEFLAVIYTLFSEYRVEPALMARETPNVARERLRRVLLDSQPRLTLQMNRAKDMTLKWVSRVEASK